LKKLQAWSAMPYRERSLYNDFKKINLLHNEASNHLNLLNLRDRVENAEETKMLLNSALEDVVFMFRKDGEGELKIGEMKGRAKQVREALERNLDKSDPEFLLLFEELRRILSKSNIGEDLIGNVDADILDLTELLEKVKVLNHKNELLAQKYGGDAKFVRVHKSLRTESTTLTDIEIFEPLDELRIVLNNLVESNERILNNRGYFEATIEQSLAIIFERQPSYENEINLEKLKLHVANEYFDEFEGAVA
jgi:type I restriction enzyme R subunit